MHIKRQSHKFRLKPRSLCLKVTCLLTGSHGDSMDEDDLKFPDPAKAEATGSSASSVSDRGNRGNTFIPSFVNLRHMVT